MQDIPTRALATASGLAAAPNSIMVRIAGGTGESWWEAPGIDGYVVVAGRRVAPCAFVSLEGHDGTNRGQTWQDRIVEARDHIEQA